MQSIRIFLISTFFFASLPAQEQPLTPAQNEVQLPLEEYIVLCQKLDQIFTDLYGETHLMTPYIGVLQKLVYAYAREYQRNQIEPSVHNRELLLSLKQILTTIREYALAFLNSFIFAEPALQEYTNQPQDSLQPSYTQGLPIIPTQPVFPTATQNPGSLSTQQDAALQALISSIQYAQQNFTHLMYQQQLIKQKESRQVLLYGFAFITGLFVIGHYALTKEYRKYEKQVQKEKAQLQKIQAQLKNFTIFLRQKINK